MKKISTGIVGLDLSLSRPAACFIPRGWKIGEWNTLIFDSWKSQEIDEKDPIEQLRARTIRMIKIAGRVRDFVCMVGARDVFFEDYAYKAFRVVPIAEMGSAVRVELLTYGRVMRPVPQATARKLLLGTKLPRGKGVLKVAIQNALYSHGAKFANDDECDAFVVANYGLSEMGQVAMSLGSKR